MAEIVRENPVGDFIRDLLNVLEANKFDEIIWVGMHEWLSYVTRVFWLKGYKFETAITPVDSRWGQEVYEDDAGHKLKITSLDYAREIGDRAVYIIANNYVDELKNQLIEMGISSSQIFGFKNGTAYHQEANARLAAKLKNGYRPMAHKEIQSVLLNLLKEFKRFCEEHGLTYYLDGGTLLGAVRHQGFIPWDNDADVIMPYEDYKKLISLYPSGGKYELIDWTNNETYFKGFAELGDNDTCVHIPYYIMADPVHLDIFPLTGYPDDREIMHIKREENFKLGQLWRECTLLSEAGIKDDRETIFNRIYNAKAKGNELIGVSHHFILSNRADKAWAVKKECFAQTVEMKFEGETFAVPIGWDEILVATYGDYMSLPAVEDRVGFPNKYFWVTRN